MSTDYQPRTSYFNYYGVPLSRAVKFLLAANILVFLFQVLFNQTGAFVKIFGLTPLQVWTHGMVWQLATYLFLHGDLLHLLLNSIALFFFGTDVEREMGTRNFCLLYFFSGIGAGLCSVAVEPFSQVPTVGASGAVFGLLVAYSVLFPHRVVTLLLFFVLPLQIRARNLAIFFGLTELLFLANERLGGSGIARMAHLGGLLFGYLYMRYEIYIIDFVSYCETWILRREGDSEEGIDKEAYMSRRINPILDKISKQGMGSLTRKERRILERAKKKYFSGKV